MLIPKLKRVRVASEQELSNWLAKNCDQNQDVMFVTCNKKSPSKYLSREQVSNVIADHGWVPGTSYTLKGNLVGHVASHGNETDRPK